MVDSSETHAADARGSSQAVRRLAWRAGRKLYCWARGEEPNAIAINGEAYVQACVVRAAKEEPLTVLDVGANVGDWSVSLLNSLPPGRSARVFAFEPIPATRNRLTATLASHPRGESARVFPVALSDEAGSASMAVMSATGGTNSLSYDADMQANALEIVEVERTTLSAFCAQEGIGRIQLAKCDAEGHDSKVLRGGLDLLREGRIDVFQFEYNFRWIHARAFLKDVFDLVADLPYRVARIRADRIEVFEAWHPEMERFFEANYLLVREPALAWFDAHRGRFDVSNTYA